ncbi:MAG: C-terminal helicase domain-containing protein [Acidimicrobiales bacterium]
MTHGYATTIHKAQGRSVDRVFVLGDDSFSTESGYTALTRGRDANAVYLVSPHREGGHGLAPEIDPVVAFREALGRSSAKTAAIDFLVRTKAHATDPKAAWRAPANAALPGPLLYWLATALVVVGLVDIGLGFHRIFHRPDGRLDRRRRLGVPTQGRLATAKDLRALLIRRPEPDRLVLGGFGRGWWPPRPRRRPGCRLAGRWPWSGPPGQANASWSPLAEADTQSGAIKAAAGLVEAAPRTGRVEGSEFWMQMAESLMAALLAVAANAERAFSEVVGWVVSRTMATRSARGSSETSRSASSC